MILPPNTPYRLTILKPQHEIRMIFEPRPRLLQALLSPERNSIPMRNRSTPGYGLRRASRRTTAGCRAVLPVPS